MEESRPGANDTERWVGFQVWKAEKGELRGASSTSEHPKTEKAFNLNPAPAQSSAQIRSSPENFLKSFPIDIVPILHPFWKFLAYFIALS